MSIYLISTYAILVSINVMLTVDHDISTIFEISFLIYRIVFVNIQISTNTRRT